MAQLNYKTLRQEVADEIRRKILKGEFKAGERIKEHEMAQLLGVSRGPVGRRCASWNRKVWSGTSETLDARWRR